MGREVVVPQEEVTQRDPQPGSRGVTARHEGGGEQRLACNKGGVRVAF